MSANSGAVEHAVPTPEALVRPWRTATVVACAIAIVELVLLVIAGLVLLGRPLSHDVRAAAAKRALASAKAPTPVAAPARRAPAVARLARAQTAILILNGNGRAGAAGAESARARAFGYRIAGVGNAARRDYARTIVMYRPGYRPEAMRLARDLGVAIVAPLDGLQPAALHGGQLAIVLGSD